MSRPRPSLTAADAATLVDLASNPRPPRSFSIYESCDILVNAGLATVAGPGRWHLTARGRAALPGARAFASARPWDPRVTWSARSASRRSEGPKRWGVFPHAEWRVTDHRTGDGVAEPTGRGYVAREISPGVPYGRMTPIRVYKRRSDADKLADKMTFGRDRARTRRSRRRR